MCDAEGVRERDIFGHDGAAEGFLYHVVYMSQVLYLRDLAVEQLLF